MPKLIPTRPNQVRDLPVGRLRAAPHLLLAWVPQTRDGKPHVTPTLVQVDERRAVDVADVEVDHLRLRGVQVVGDSATILGGLWHVSARVVSDVYGWTAPKSAADWLDVLRRHVGPATLPNVPPKDAPEG